MCVCVCACARACVLRGDSDRCVYTRTTPRWSSWWRHSTIILARRGRTGRRAHARECAQPLFSNLSAAPACRARWQHTFIWGTGGDETETYYISQTAAEKNKQNLERLIDEQASSLQKRLEAERFVNLGNPKDLLSISDHVQRAKQSAAVQGFVDQSNDLRRRDPSFFLEPHRLFRCIFSCVVRTKQTAGCPGPSALNLHDDLAGSIPSSSARRNFPCPSCPFGLRGKTYGATVRFGKSGKGT